jgi:hypothetical protein
MDRELAQLAHVARLATWWQAAFDHRASAEPGDGERACHRAGLGIAEGVTQRRIEQRQRTAQQRAKGPWVEAGQQRERGIRDGAPAGE